MAYNEANLPLQLICCLDSGFCVSKGLIALRKKGVFPDSLIKKHCFCPMLVPGDHILEYFNCKAVGRTDAISGMLDGIKYNIWKTMEWQ